jgi:hypothetical protein
VSDRLGDLERLSRARHRPAVPRRASERLIPDNAVAAKLPDRLEGHSHAPLVEQPAHGADLVDPRHRGQPVELVGRDGHVAAPPLRLVQGGVRPLPEGVGVLALLGQGGDTTAQGDARQVLGGRPDTLDRLARAPELRVREEQRELVAPDAEGPVAGPPFDEQAGERLQEPVAMTVPAAVVLQLEVVQVQHR